MKESKSKIITYALGMFITSIHINLLKTYTAIYYVDALGLKTTH